MRKAKNIKPAIYGGRWTEGINSPSLQPSRHMSFAEKGRFADTKVTSLRQAKVPQ